MAEETEVPTTGNEISASEASEKLAAGEIQLIDVRQPHEWEAGHIEGAEHIELNELPAQSEQIDKDKPVVFQCKSGGRSAMATQAFAAAGYDAHNLEGGIIAWVEAGLPIEPADGTVADPLPDSSRDPE